MFPRIPAARRIAQLAVAPRRFVLTKEFSKRELAQEDQYTMKRDADELIKLKKLIETKHNELEALKKKHADMHQAYQERIAQDGKD